MRHGEGVVSRIRRVLGGNHGNPCARHTERLSGKPTILTCPHTPEGGWVGSKRDGVGKRKTLRKASKLAKAGKAALPGISSGRSPNLILPKCYLATINHGAWWCAVSIQWTDIRHPHLMSWLWGYVLQLKCCCHKSTGQGLGGLSAHVKNIVCCFFRSYWPVGEKVTRALFPSTLAT